ncbi:hypothetical protein OsccyDRAFT_3221 [Leptolyngbyaceae cyanobacterium JSC-12]|nr:hypothetical protein OsccyDRAFT_3221 [Leptolyngbyaceae cyanobacterium JSC-12]
MVSDSTSGRRVQHSSPKIAEFVGTLIAVLTLTLPAVVVAQYSSRPDISTIAPYAVSRSNNR